MSNGVFMMPLGLWHSDITQQGYFLVGKLLGRHTFNFEAFKTTMLNSFNRRGMDFRLIEEGRILFRFNHSLDRRKVMEGGPWALDKNLLVLRQIEENDNPAHIDLSWTDFYIHVHDLPLSRMMKEIATFIGNQLGIFCDVDLNRGGQGWGSSLRIRIGIYITKPLRRIMKLCTTMGEESVISFSYERLPNFCYWCGKLGHIMKFCDCQYEDGFDESQEQLPFGP
ncbi:hypothetical protein Salat_1154000 [Sesamum alatum]|uniref:CCHC-type domain-containing protein n=1 Tax=Sesamum alatum TaxID=300844 RepID=A0AAE1YEE5_9LAMI|nr:hypothetical protein Salat_1154000 [Sesamum alatum]